MSENNVEFNRFINVYEHFSEIQENNQIVYQEEEGEDEVEIEMGDVDENRADHLQHQLSTFLSMNN